MYPYFPNGIRGFTKKSSSLFHCHSLPLFSHVSAEVSGHDARGFGYLECDAIQFNLCSILASFLLDIFGKKYVLYPFKLFTHHII
jgi:hypothetical protein